MAVDDDQRRPPPLALELVEGTIEQLEVVGVADPGDVPAVGEEARRDIVAEGQIRVALDGDPVAVVDPAEIG